MFNRAWIENELAGLIVHLHQTEGAIQVLQQMLKQITEAEQSASDGIPLDTFISSALPGSVVESIDPIEGVEPHEDKVYTRLSRETDQ